MATETDDSISVIPGNSSSILLDISDYPLLLCPQIQPQGSQVRFDPQNNYKIFKLTQILVQFGHILCMNSFSSIIPSKYSISDVRL